MRRAHARKVGIIYLIRVLMDPLSETSIMRKVNLYIN